MQTETMTTTTTDSAPTNTPKPRTQKRKARAHGEGSVCFEPRSSKWLAVVSLGYVNGKRKRKRLSFDTQAEARRALTKLTTSMDAGISTGDDRMTVRAFLEKWLAECVEGPMSSLRSSSRVSYASLVRNHLLPGLGHHTLAKLSPLHVQAFLTSKLTETVTTKGEDGVPHTSPRLAPRTVQYLHAILRSALKRAERWGLVARNVAKLVDAPSPSRREAASLTTEQAGKLLVAVEGDRLRALFSVAVAMGLRRGEIVGLRWEHIDLVAGVMRVREQLLRVKHVRDAEKKITARRGLTVSELKTDKSRRTLKVPAAVLVELVEHSKQQKTERLKAGSLWKDTGYVFATPFGEPLDGRYVLDQWKAALTAAGLPSMPFHASRHTAGSFLLAQGADLRTVMGVLGHSQIALTANTYAHVLEEMHDGAALHADAALSAARASFKR